VTIEVQLIVLFEGPVQVKGGGVRTPKSSNAVEFSPWDGAKDCTFGKVKWYNRIIPF
jgi:hypothetical protein